MTRQYHNHILHTNQWHHKEESKNDNSDMTFRTQQKYQLFFPQRDDCKTRKDIKYCKNKTMTLSKTPTNNGSDNKKEINSSRAMALEQTTVEATGGGGV